MEAKIREAFPSAWLAIAFGAWRIRSHASDFELVQQAIRGVAEPTRMSRLERDTAIESFSQHGEKSAGDPGVECKARRELHEQAAEARGQRCEVREERLEQRRTIRELLIMRDRSRDLHGEPKCARYARRPSCKCRSAMGTIKRGIDFYSGKHLRITREVRFAWGKAALIRARNAPSCGPDISLRGHGDI